MGKNVAIMGSEPFDIDVATNNTSPTGYTETMCIECTNGFDKVRVDKWSVK